MMLQLELAKRSDTPKWIMIVSVIIIAGAHSRNDVTPPSFRGD